MKHNGVTKLTGVLSTSSGLPRMFGSVNLPALGAEDWTRLQGTVDGQETLNREGTMGGEGKVDKIKGAVDGLKGTVDRVLATALISRTTASTLVRTSSCAWLARWTGQGALTIWLRSNC